MKQDALEIQMCPQAEQNSSSSFQANITRMLHCTALAMANGPGGLLFIPGAKPWLDGLSMFPRQCSTSMTTL